MNAHGRSFWIDIALRHSTFVRAKIGIQPPNPDKFQRELPRAKNIIRGC